MSFITGRRKSRETIGVVGALALVISPLVVGATATSAGAADPDIVVSTDFEDDSWQDSWQQSGGPTLALVDDGGNQVLEIANRAADYEGIETKPAAVPFEHGAVYTLSARAKLGEDAGGPLEVRAVRKVATPDGPQSDDYAWVGNTLVGTEWTDIVGTFSIPEGADASTAAVYFGTSALNPTEEVTAGEPYTYYLDDIVITKPASGPAVVLSSDFEDSETAPWQPRDSGVSLAISDDGRESDHSLLVSGRTSNWHGVETPINGLFDGGATYEVSAWVKLAPGEEATGVKFTVAETPENYTGLADPVTVTDSAWVEISGSYTRPDTVTGGVLYLEAAGATTSFLVDDVVILGPPSDAWSPEPDPDFVPGGAVGATASAVSQARGSGDVAALTFDDGPNGTATSDLLDFLGDNNIQATFCVIGQNIQAEGGAALLQRMVAEGHTLCNHSTGYADMGAMTHSQVEADLKANLEIIRTALGDPSAQVPYFRAPNGSWGVTGEVAAALGMQPLALGNTLADFSVDPPVADWDTPQPSVEVLEGFLRNAIQPGAIVLVHDGGGDRANGIAAVQNVIPEFLADGWTFTLPRGGAPVPSYSKSFDFEDGTLQGWTPRANEEGPATVDVTDEEAFESTYAAIVTDRVHQGQGIGYEVTDEFQPGVMYDISARLKFAEGQTPGNVALTLESSSGGSTPTYGTVGTFEGMSNSQWVEVTGALTMPTADFAYLYFETEWADGEAGNTSTFLVDDIVFEARVPSDIQDITPLMDTVTFPLGVAIDSRETLGAPSELLRKHFNQISAENHMKVESFYDGAWNFRAHPQALEIADFAVANDLRLYGHVLVWHSQTPDWFFQDDDGAFLTNSAEDKEEMRDRMRTHIFNVAEAFADEYGLYGSDTNPFVAWDVVNEVVDDGTQYPDGLRRSHWYNILGEEFIHLAFEYAEEAFNDVYAADGADRPVQLFINDYNTEQVGKQSRYRALVDRMLAADTPIDGVGHQFHVSLAMPTANLDAAIERFKGLGLRQAVTELDVTVMADNRAQLAEQGHYYKAAFDIFRKHAAELEAVTIWGLTDGRSWRSTGKPLLFDDDLQAKPAYYGAADSADLPPLIRSAKVFAKDVDAKQWPPSHNEWNKLQLHDIGDNAGFQLRWASDQLTAFVDVKDATKSAADAVIFQHGDKTVTFKRDGTGDVNGVVEEKAGGYAVVVELPATITEGGTATFDVRVTDNGSTAGWNSPGEVGILTFIEELSYVQVLPAPQAPVIDGAVDAAWANATKVRTEKFVSGSSGAQADVRTLWRDNTLYILAEVTDPIVDVTGSDPWIQDSVELYVDAGNFKQGGYRYEDTQIRISAENAVSFGNGGDEAYQAARVVSETSLTATGYVVEAAINLLEYGGAGTFHGLDFQVNDASEGARTSIANWADPTGAGYQSTERWGVGKLVTALEDDGPFLGDPDPVDVAPKITQQPKNVTAKAGKVVTLKAKASGTPTPTVQWQKRAVRSTKWKNVKGGTSANLKVKNTKKASGTRYRAVFTNAAGKATTRGAKVAVKQKKAKVTLHPKAAKNVKAGKKVKLRAKAKGAFPKAKVTWQQRKPGSKKWTKVKGARKATLVVVASHKTDGARYRAVFSNRAGSVRTKVAKVTVRDTKPVFVSQPKHASVKKGKAATFSAKVAANPRAKLQWYSKAPGARTWTAVKGAKASTLKVRANKARTGTRYVLIAFNAKGWTASKMVRISVKG